MNLPDVAEMRELIRRMPPAKRDELKRLIFGGKSDLSRLSFHELRRFRYLGEKLTQVWPYCAGMFGSLTLTELFTALDDDEMGDYLNLCRWTRGDERPSDHPFVGHNAIRELESDGYHPPAWRPDQPLREAQRIVSEGGHDA